MSSILRAIIAAITIGLLSGHVAAEPANMLPKYGGQAKNEAQLAADRKFVAEVDAQYKGNRKQAAKDIAARGWQYLREGKHDDAMRRFNQAWLVDSRNGHTLWGMAALSAIKGRIDDSLALFSEASQFVGDDIDFAVDHAKTIGLAGANAGDQAKLKDAFSRFAKLHERAPMHTLNLQNWAITLFYVGDYAEAWKIVKLAEATPRGAMVDQNFVAALSAKMPRP